MKHIVLALLLIKATIAPVMALPDKELVISGSDGTASCVVKDIRRIVFDDGLMRVDMRNGSFYNWSTDLVDRVLLADYEPDIETSLSGVENEPGFVLSGGVLYIVLPCQSNVRLTACDGKLFRDAVCVGELSIDMRQLPAGIYLLDIDGRIYKIMNR